MSVEVGEFVQLLRGLHNIDGYCLEPEFDAERRVRFCRAPVRYLMVCDDADRAVIWRELKKRGGKGKGDG